MTETHYSHLAGHEVDGSSEEWRFECECRWLLNNKPTRSTKHLYLYGVSNRTELMTHDKDGKEVLREDYRTRWPEKTRPLMHHRGLAGADRILDGARRLHEIGVKAS